MIKKDIKETTIYRTKGKVGFIEYVSLNRFPWLLNAFSTRKGGVSSGQYATMNLSRTVGDSIENVNENFRLFGEAIGVDTDNMVMAEQKHTSCVIRVDGKNMGMGITRERDFHSVDGLVTDTEGLCLVTSFADCVPLYFVDPVHHAIGLTHSGWRGTVAKIGTKTIELMKKEFGTEPSELICCIGPCIGKECYEVSEEVALEFAKAYGPEEYERICSPKPDKEGKYLLDLPRANFEQFIDMGVREENISLPDLCTCCNHDLLHSHRASGGKRGGMCAFLMIRE